MTTSTFFLIAAMICLVGVVFSFVRGIFFMTRGEQKDRASSNKMMQMRVWFQGLTLFFLFLAYLAR